MEHTDNTINEEHVYPTFWEKLKLQAIYGDSESLSPEQKRTHIIWSWLVGFALLSNHILILSVPPIKSPWFSYIIPGFYTVLSFIPFILSHNILQNYTFIDVIVQTLHVLWLISLLGSIGAWVVIIVYFNLEYGVDSFDIRIIYTFVIASILPISICVGLLYALYCILKYFVDNCCPLYINTVQLVFSNNNYDNANQEDQDMTPIPSRQDII